MLFGSNLFGLDADGLFGGSGMVVTGGGTTAPVALAAC